MVLQEFVYMKEKSEKVAKDLERLNKIKRNEEKLNVDKHGGSDTRKHNE